MQPRVSLMKLSKPGEHALKPLPPKSLVLQLQESPVLTNLVQKEQELWGSGLEGYEGFGIEGFGDLGFEGFGL